MYEISVMAVSRFRLLRYSVTDGDFPDQQVMRLIPFPFNTQAAKLGQIRRGVVLLKCPEVSPQSVMVQRNPVTQRIAQNHPTETSISNWVSFCPFFGRLFRPDNMR
jgi:hypothetical protein